MALGFGQLETFPNFRNLHNEWSKRPLKKLRRIPIGTFTLALNYGSRQEVLEAVHSYSQQTSPNSQKPNWEDFEKHLQTKGLPDPDLIIRTSGEFRLSNFLLLQAAYAEIFVSPLHWPDFDRSAFLEALKNYVSRERRFGKTSEQILPIQAS